MTDVIMSFYMILPSNACPETQPDNNAGNFIVDWESPIALDGQWEVALIEYNFNSFIPDLKKDISVTLEYDEINVFNRFNIAISGGVLTINGQPKFVDDDLVIRVDDEGYFVINSKHETAFSIFVHTNELAPAIGFEEISYEITTGSSRTKIPKDVKDVAGDMHVNIPRKYIRKVTKKLADYNPMRTIAESFAFFVTILEQFTDQITIDSENLISLKFKPRFRQVVLSEHLSGCLGFNTTTFTTGDVHRAEMAPLIGKPFTQIFIYSSIVDNVFVGGGRFPLLRTIFIENEFRQRYMISDDIHIPMYLNVSSNSINKIEVQVRDDSGELIQFQYGSKLFLTLHFRLKKNE
jgi:hypothetical protein